MSGWCSYLLFWNLQIGQVHVCLLGVFLVALLQSSSVSPCSRISYSGAILAIEWRSGDPLLDVTRLQAGDTCDAGSNADTLKGHQHHIADSEEMSGNLSVILSVNPCVVWYGPLGREITWAPPHGHFVWTNQLLPGVHERYPQSNAWSMGWPSLQSRQQTGWIFKGQGSKYFNCLNCLLTFLDSSWR